MKREGLRTKAIATTMFVCLASFVSAGELSFQNDIQPILTARSCNQGACHGKARGQNGFQLSLLAYDSDFDHAAITQQSRGRRIFPASPERSLLLLKATGTVPHGGGVRIDPAGDDYRMLLAWIEQGAPRRIEREPKLTSLTVEPTLLEFHERGSRSLQATATYDNGSQRNVTALAAYQSNEEGIAAVDRAGNVRAGDIPGEAAIMVRYMNEIVSVKALIPLAQRPAEAAYAELPPGNYIDEHVTRKLKTLGLIPSPPIDDAKFLRRVSLDLIGRLPAASEVRSFLADTSSDKRARAIDAILQRPEYADHWSAKWADLLRPNPYRVGIKATLNYDAWIRESFRENKPYDRFVFELLTAEGSVWENGAAVLFRDRRDPPEITTLVSQLFLGVRLECAKCHHHPFEKWGQDDFYSFAAYFARLGQRGQGVSPPISGGEEVIVLKEKGDVTHPITGEVLAPRPLFGNAPEIPEGSDPRRALANWIVSKENPFFAQTAVNRVWAELMVRGIVEPVDDLRATNPPSNPELLAALAESFQRANFDLKQLLREICNSRTYAASSLPHAGNAVDSRNFSRHYRSRMRAETAHDAVSDMLGVRDSFSAVPEQSRATELWTTRVNSVFLDTFGRPNPNQDPPCERSPEPTVTQTLHLMNSPQLYGRVTSDTARPARLAASKLSPVEIVEEFYLLAYSRLPDEAERAIGLKTFEHSANRRQACEDLAWALMNTPEFSIQD